MALATVLAGVTSSFGMSEYYGAERWFKDSEIARVFDSARIANSNLADMSNQEITDYMSGLEPEQVVGMVSLVKGRYFEEYVAETTGGILFEAKNHPDVDITIDGVDIQLKSGSFSVTDTNDFIVHTPSDYGLTEQYISTVNHDVLMGADGSDVVIDGVISGSILHGVVVGVDVFNTVSQMKKNGAPADELIKMSAIGAVLVPVAIAIAPLSAVVSAIRIVDRILGS